MKVDGNQIQNDIKDRLQKRLAKKSDTPRLDIVYAGSDPVIEMFTQLKQDFGASIGAGVAIHSHPQDVRQAKLLDQIEDIVQQDKTDGLVVQLPLPEHLSENRILHAIPKRLDVDVLSQKAYEQFKNESSSILPPVVGAVSEVCDHYQVAINSLQVAVVGAGRLVGQPVIDWLQLQGVTPLVIEEGDSLQNLKQADVIISGAGDAHIIQPEHITEGVVLLDAGTSQTEGGTDGDIDPSCADKARLFSPVPGGIGPITVARLFVNLCTLSFANNN